MWLKGIKMHGVRDFFQWMRLRDGVVGLYDFRSREFIPGNPSAVNGKAYEREGVLRQMAKTTKERKP